MTLTPAELAAFRSGLPLSDLLAVSRAEAIPRRVRFWRTKRSLVQQLRAGEISREEYRARIAEAARRGGR